MVARDSIACEMGRIIPRVIPSLIALITDTICGSWCSLGLGNFLCPRGNIPRCSAFRGGDPDIVLHLLHVPTISTLIISSPTVRAVDIRVPLRIIGPRRGRRPWRGTARPLELTQSLDAFAAHDEALRGLLLNNLSIVQINIYHAFLLE